MTRNRESIILSNSKVSSMKAISVRFIGNIGLNTKKDETILYFTDTLSSHITECSITHYTIMKRSKFDKIVNDMYLKKKDEPINLEESNLPMDYELNQEIIKMLDRKLTMFRYGQKLDVLVDDKEVVEFRNFYPKAAIFDAKLLYTVSKKIYNIVNQSEYAYIPLDSAIFASAYESFNSLLRFPLSLEPDYKIARFVKENYSKLDKVEDLMVSLSSVSIDYILASADISELDKRKENILLEIRKNISLLRNLYLQYKNFIMDEFPKELYKVFVPKIDGNKINVTEKIIHKSTIKAHKRKVKMSEAKRQEVLSALEENDLEVQGISKIITKENFDEFDWESMTIVDEFSKNVLSNKKRYR